MEKMKKIYIGTLYRFGYDLQVVALTEAEVKKALKAEYMKAYKEINGCNPSIEEKEHMIEDIEIWEAEIGKIEWR